jgi:hypothetical protein
VKIRVVHHACGREVLVQQILATGGHCPWDGRALNPHYTAVLAEAMEAAETAGSALENALEKIAGMEPDFHFVRETVLGPIEEHLDRLERAQRGRR